MANVTVRKGDTEFQIHDLTFEQVKELIGVNGYGHVPKSPQPNVRTLPTSSSKWSERRPDFRGFLEALSSRGKDFVTIVKQHPDGIEANELAGKLGYKDARQVGGLTGGGLAKIAKLHHIRLKDVYRSTVTFPDGQRTRTFYPSKFIYDWIHDEKPAV